MIRVGLWCAALAACAGTQTSAASTLPDTPLGAERAVCPETARLSVPTTRPGHHALTIEASLCGEVVRITVPYDEETRVGENWLVPARRLREALSSATQRDVPPIEDWDAEETEFGRLAPLAGDWLYVGHGEPAMLGTFIHLRDTEQAEVLIARIQAVFGASPVPIFVTDSWQGEKPALVVVADDETNVFGPRILRAYLGPGGPWLDGFAAFLWQYVKISEGQLTTADYLDSWLADYSEHRRTLSGQPHRQSALAARVKSVCMLPSLGLAETRRLQHRLPEHEPAWLDERGVLDVRDCLAAVGVELAAIRYEDETPENLLRVRSAPGDPPTVERGGSFFQTGDVIVEVNRRRIHVRGDVAWALRDVSTGERFIIIVQRAGQEARTWARRPRVGERNAVRFTLIPVEVDES
ncbi:MAG: hypothetical protein ACI9KE_000283 [Polyangiales bacterium]|jgi:hypothetical protein